MIKTIILVILLLMYMWVGSVIFSSAVQSLGGKDEYMKEIGCTTKLSADLTYLTALLMVVFGWPYFLISGLLRRRK